MIIAYIFTFKECWHEEGIFQKKYVFLFIFTESAEDTNGDKQMQSVYFYLAKRQYLLLLYSIFGR